MAKELAPWKPWEPLKELQRMRTDMDRLWESFFEGKPVRHREEMSGWVPSLDLAETKDSYVVKAEIPGMAKDAINVSMKEGVLSISGEKKTEERKDGENWHRIERAFGTFQRSFYIPTEVDETKVKAAYKDGVLTVSMPKREEAKRKEIPIAVE